MMIMYQLNSSNIFKVHFGATNSGTVWDTKCRPKTMFFEILYFVGLLLLQDEEDDRERCWHDITLKRLV